MLDRQSWIYSGKVDSGLCPLQTEQRFGRCAVLRRQAGTLVGTSSVGRCVERGPRIAGSVCITAFPPYHLRTKEDPISKTLRSVHSTGKWTSPGS